MSDKIRVTSKLEFTGGEEGGYLGASSGKTITGEVERKYDISPDIIADAWVQIELTGVEPPFWLAVRNNSETDYCLLSGYDDGSGLALYLPPKPAGGEGYTQVVMVNSGEGDNGSLWFFTPTNPVNVSIFAVQPLVE